jgi:ribosomal protein S18 acetylase RimI-like enzyme
MPSPQIVVDPSVIDLPKIARCHRRAFPRALSSSMGQVYVERMLEWYLVDERAFMFYLADGEDCAGYCGGILIDGKSAFGSATNMIQHSFQSAIRAMITRPWLFFHPEFVGKHRLVFKNVWRRLRSLLGNPPRAGRLARNVPPHSGLVVIGVAPEFQGKGMGQMLLDQFDKESAKRGYTLQVLTVRSDNHHAIRAYERNGWVVVKRSGKSVSMQKSLM